jgi:hypothetical protein
MVERKIFVFGSNLAGRHGKGAALAARREHGAVYGQGEGPQGFAYAIPTKDAHLNTLPLDAIAAHVDAFTRYAAANPRLVFQVTPIGCGLAGYRPAQIAPMFHAAPANCELPPEFIAVLSA